MKRKNHLSRIFFILLLFTIAFSFVFMINNYIEKNYNLNKVVQETEKLPNFVPLNKIPNSLKDAFISIEDQRFNNHIGIDPIAIIGSFKDNLEADKIIRGGSTITQQLAKNLYLSGDKTFKRKSIEAAIALKLSYEFSKEEILQSYLNRINLGNGAFGVEEASNLYFSKNVEDLSISQSALIASITKSPEKLAPFTKIPKTNYVDGHIIIKYKDNYLVLNKSSIDRQKVVLKKMYELKHISKDEYNEAINFDIKSSIKPNLSLLRKLGG